MYTIYIYIYIYIYNKIVYNNIHYNKLVSIFDKNENIKMKISIYFYKYESFINYRIRLLKLINLS